MNKPDEKKSLWTRFSAWVNGTADILPEEELIHGGAPRPAPERKRAAEPTPEQEDRRLRGFRKVYVAVVAAVGLVVIGVLMAAVMDLPPFGQPGAPTNNEVARHYLEQGEEETGAANAVAGMILSYRGFDTFGESCVLFLAVSSVSMLLLRDEKNPGPRDLARLAGEEAAADREEDVILRQISGLILPFIFLFGLYTLLNGHLSPGGGLLRRLHAGGRAGALRGGLRVRKHPAVLQRQGVQRRPGGGADALCRFVRLLHLHRRQRPAQPPSAEPGRPDPAHRRGGGSGGGLHHVRLLRHVYKGGTVMSALLENRFAVTAVLLFGIGLANMLLQRNLIKKIVGFNIMDSAVFLLLASRGFVEGRVAPILTEGAADASRYINPIPSGLVLTGIVVSVSISAFSLALVQRIYRAYGTVEMNELLRRVKKEAD